MASAFFLSSLWLSKRRKNSGEQARRGKENGDRFSSRRIMRKAIRNHGA